MKYEPFHYSSLKELKAKFDEYSLPFYAQENTDILFKKGENGQLGAEKQICYSAHGGVRRERPQANRAN